MASAASSQSSKPADTMSLVISSVIGAALVLAFAALVLRGVPMIWNSLADSLGIKDPIVMMTVQITAQLAAAVGLILVSSMFGSGQRASGVRGGIFFVIATAFVAFFTLKGLYRAMDNGFSFGNIVVMLFYVVILFLIVQFFRTGRFTQWSIAMDQGGWFDTHSHKKTQGLRVRRLTILGILLIAGSGIWTLMNHNYLPTSSMVRLPEIVTKTVTDENGFNRDVRSVELKPEQPNRMGDWVVGGTQLEPVDVDPKASELDKEFARMDNRARPRVEGGVTLLPDLQFTVPLLMIAATLWLAWRAVNYPTFADFLIATEAEINKVSWTTRRALIRDTIVVLVSLVLVTLFLFVVDVFWGWLLSREMIAVLPTEAEQQAAKPQGDPKPIQDW